MHDKLRHNCEKALQKVLGGDIVMEKGEIFADYIQRSRDKEKGGSRTTGAVLQLPGPLSQVDHGEKSVD